MDTFTIGGDLEVHRLGFGAMRITGKGIWGPPDDPEEAKRLLAMAENPKVHVLLALGYGAGLRAGEVVRLRAGDIDRAQAFADVERLRVPDVGSRHLRSASMATTLRRAFWMNPCAPERATRSP